MMRKRQKLYLIYTYTYLNKIVSWRRGCEYRFHLIIEWIYILCILDYDSFSYIRLSQVVAAAMCVKQFRTIFPHIKFQIINN